MNQDHVPGASGPDRKKERETVINCFSCQHFYITYDAQFPYGCRTVGFKSRLLPSKEMYANSGMDCQFFADKGKTR
jgi:hypothetical protein